MRAVSQLLTLALAAGLLAGCGQAPAVPAHRTATSVDAQASQAARDKICQMLIAEYKGIQWYQNADRKKLLLESIVATGSDLAVDLLIAEYQSIQWYQDEERKKFFLEMLKKLSTPTVETKEDVVDRVIDKVKNLKRRLPSLSALKRLVPALKKDYDDAPADQKKVVDGIIAKIQIIAPGTSR